MSATSNTHFGPTNQAIAEVFFGDGKALREILRAAKISTGYGEIASLCKEINPEWAEQLAGKVVFSMEEARKRLDKIAVETIQCSALILNEVRFHREINYREQIVITPVYIGNNPKYKEAIQKKYNLSDETTIPLSQKEIDFYLMWGGKIYRIQMSSESNLVAELPKVQADNAYVWDISTSKIADLAKQNLSDCFVTATYSWDKVIPL